MTSPPPHPEIRPAIATDVYCPQCSYELDSWEIHLLKHLACPCCGAQVDLGVSVELSIG